MKFTLFMLIMIVITTWMTTKYKVSVVRKMDKLNEDSSLSYAKKIIETCRYMLDTVPFHCGLVIAVWVIGSTVFYLLILQEQPWI